MKIYKLGESKNNRLDSYPSNSNNFDRTILAKGHGSNRTLLLQASWVWNSKVTKLVESLIEGYTLNCPCGASELGDVRGDLYPIDDSIQKMDMNELPFPDCTFDTVIQDPPWKINFFHRQQPFKEGLRVLKWGGRMIYNATWIPSSKYVTLEQVIVRQDSRFTTASVISVFRKHKIKQLSNIKTNQTSE